MKSMNVADYIVEPLMRGQSVPAKYRKAIHDKLGDKIRIYYDELSHERCDVTGEETSCYLVRNG